MANNEGVGEKTYKIRSLIETTEKKLMCSLYLDMKAHLRCKFKVRAIVG